MASENYGYMAPIKAALDSSLVFLAKSFSRFSRVRFNAVAPGLAQNFGLGRHSRLCRRVSLRRASHAPQAGRGDRAKWPMSRRFCSARRSSGINAQTIVIDAGMGVNYFDQELVSRPLDGSD